MNLENTYTTIIYSINRLHVTYNQTVNIRGGQYSNWRKTRNVLLNKIVNSCFINSNWDVNVNDTTPFWFANKTLNADFPEAKHSEDINWNWMVEAFETSAHHNF